MRKGTFSVQTATAFSSKHNSRELAPKYLIDTSAKNYYELLKKDDDFILEAQAIYKEKIKQTMQKKQVENLIQETVLTLQPHQNENDVKELFTKLNKKYGGHELLEIAIHRDEGYFLKDDIAYYPTKNILKKDDNSWYICSNADIKKPKKDDFDTPVNIDEFEKVYNYHAHAKFTMFDRESGKTARMQKKHMSERIKFVSDELGLIFSPGENSRVKKSVNQIKDEHLARAREKESVQYNFREMQQRITALQELDAEQKKQLHKLNTEINKIKDDNTLKAQKIEELEAKIQEMKSEYKKTIDFVAKYSELEVNSTFWKDFKNKMQNIAHNESETAQKLTNAEKTIQSLINQKADVVAANMAFKEQIAELTQTISVKNKAIETDEKSKKSFLEHFKAPQNTHFWGFLKQKVSSWLKEIRELKEENSKLKEENQFITNCFNAQIESGKEKDAKLTEQVQKIEELKKIVDYPGVADFYRDKVFQQIQKNQSNHRQLER